VISPQQYQALRYLQRYTYEQGHPPTYREISEHCEIHVQTIVQKFRRLRARGLLDVDPVRSQRAFLLTPDGHRALAEFEILNTAALANLRAMTAELPKFSIKGLWAKLTGGV
jgi:DNA-binding MarR family transcriptional regulator